MPKIVIYIIFAMIDYLLGTLVAFAGKSKKGNPKSHIMKDGIIRKVCCVVLIFIAWIIENEMKVVGLYSMVVYGFVISEGISILEICHSCGVKSDILDKWFSDNKGE